MNEKAICTSDKNNQVCQSQFKSIETEIGKKTRKERHSRPPFFYFPRPSTSSNTFVIFIVVFFDVRVQPSPCFFRITQIELLDRSGSNDPNAEILSCDWVIEIFDFGAKCEIISVVWFCNGTAWGRRFEASCVCRKKGEVNMSDD